jgi:hypothetical protein
VVTADELGTEYLFSRQDLIRTVGFLALTLVLFFLVFTNQEPINAFMAHSGWYAGAVKDTFLSRFDWMPKVIVALTVFLFVPVVAFSYGAVARAALKLMRME